MSKNRTKKTGVKTSLICFICIIFAVAAACGLKKAIAHTTETDVSFAVIQADDTTIKTAESGVTINDSENLIDTETENILIQYAKAYEDTLINLESGDISDLYAEYGYQYYLNKTAFNAIRAIRSLSRNNLTLEYMQITYNILSAETYDGKTVITLTEDNMQKFRFLNDESLSQNIYHEFTVENTDDGIKITAHSQEEDFYLLAETAYEDTYGSDYAQRCSDAVDAIIRDAEENIAEVTRLQENTDIETITADMSYDRDAATAYAAEYWNKRNTDSDYLIYDDYGGNCQNFVSQCIHAGGIEMDYSGTWDEQWKFYGENLNTRQTAGGRSYSWIGVDEFYTYATSGNTDGMICQADIPLIYAEKGDVIQVGAYGEWHHSLFVQDVLYDENGDITDIIVDSNTTDRYNYPLSAYTYTYPRLIHIAGQN